MASTPGCGVPSLNNPQVFFDKDLNGEAILNLVMTTDEDNAIEFELTILQMPTSESETVAITADRNTPVNDWLRGIQQYFATKYSLESAFFHLENGQPIIMPQYLNKGSLLDVGVRGGCTVTAAWQNLERKMPTSTRGSRSNARAITPRGKKIADQQAQQQQRMPLQPAGFSLLGYQEQGSNLPSISALEITEAASVVSKAKLTNNFGQLKDEEQNKNLLKEFQQFMPKNLEVNSLQDKLENFRRERDRHMAELNEMESEIVVKKNLVTALSIMIAIIQGQKESMISPLMGRQPLQSDINEPQEMVQFGTQTELSTLQSQGDFAVQAPPQEEAQVSIFDVQKELEDIIAGGNLENTPAPSVVDDNMFAPFENLEDTNGKNTLEPSEPANCVDSKWGKFKDMKEFEKNTAHLWKNEILKGLDDLRRRRDVKCMEGKAQYTIVIRGMPNGICDESVNQNLKNLPGYEALYCKRREPTCFPNDPPGPYELEGMAFVKFRSNVEACWAKELLHERIWHSAYVPGGQPISAHWALNETRIPRHQRDPESMVMIRHGIALKWSNEHQRAEIPWAPGIGEKYPFQQNAVLHCGACGQVGHLRRNCPVLKEGMRCEFCGMMVLRDSVTNVLKGHISDFKICQENRQGSWNRQRSASRARIPRR